MSLQNSNTINLVSGRKQELKERHLLYVKVQFAAMAVLVVFAGMLLLIYGVKVYAATSLSGVRNEIKIEETAISKKQALEAKYRILTNKLGLMEKFLADNQTVVAWFTQVYDTLPPGIKLDSVELNNNEQIMSLSLSMASMEQALAYLNQLETQIQTNTLYDQARIDGVARSVEGTYQMQIEYSL